MEVCFYDGIIIISGKKMNTCSTNMQWKHSMKRPNIRINIAATLMVVNDTMLITKSQIEMSFSIFFNWTIYTVNWMQYKTLLHGKSKTKTKKY